MTHSHPIKPVVVNDRRVSSNTEPLVRWRKSCEDGEESHLAVGDDCKAMSEHSFTLNDQTDVLPTRTEVIEVVKSNSGKNKWRVSGLDIDAFGESKEQAMGAFLTQVYETLAAPKGYPNGGEIERESYVAMKTELQKIAKESDDEDDFIWNR